MHQAVVDIFFHFKKKVVSHMGYTLIELLIVVTIMGLMAVVGVEFFLNYSQSQAVNTATNDVVAYLKQIRSWAQTQVGPLAVCQAGESFEGYYAIIASPDYYPQQACRTAGGMITAIGLSSSYTKSLPPGITFTGGGSFYFPLRTGRVDLTDCTPFTVGGYGRTKEITLCPDGRIQSN